MPMSHMIDPATHSNIPGASHFIFRSDARLIAHPRLRSEILRSKGLLTATNCGDATLASLYRTVIGQQETLLRFRCQHWDLLQRGPACGARMDLCHDHVPGPSARPGVRVGAMGFVGRVDLTPGFVLAATALVLKRQVDRPWPSSGTRPGR